MFEKVEVWGRFFDLKVDYDLYPGEEILDEQKKRLDSFISQTDVLNNSEPIIRYCLVHNKTEIGDNIENIFDYVLPKTIFVSHSNPEIALLCDYKFDIEHGIAVIYKNNNVFDIVSQDEIL